MTRLYSGPKLDSQMIYEACRRLIERSDDVHFHLAREGGKAHRPKYIEHTAYECNTESTKNYYESEYCNYAPSGRIAVHTFSQSVLEFRESGAVKEERRHGILLD